MSEKASSGASSVEVCPPSVLDDNYKRIYTQLSSERPNTRVNAGAIGCGMSLLCYIIISLRWGEFVESDFSPEKQSVTSNLFTKIENLKIILESCKTDHKVNSFVGANLLVNQVEKGHKVEEVRVKASRVNIPIYSMLLRGLRGYDENSCAIFPMALAFKNEYTNNKLVINHFFAIIKRGTSFSIVSSYGSVVVCAEQSEKSLDEGELNDFIDAINKPVYEPNDLATINEFMTKFFFDERSLIKYVRSVGESITKKGITKTTFTTTPSAEGVVQELMHYNPKFECWFCPDFFDDVKGVVDSFGPLVPRIEDAGSTKAHVGGKRKTKTKKRKKVRKGRRSRRSRRSRRTKTSRRSKRS